MKNTLYLKFSGIYIVFAFLVVFICATLTSELLLQLIKGYSTENLNQEAQILATSYLDKYFEEEITEIEVTNQLMEFEEYTESTAWFVDAKGTVLAYGNLNPEAVPPEQIEDFNPAESGNSYYLLGDYHGYLAEESITVIAPITTAFAIRGYLIVHKPYQGTLRFHGEVLSIVYLTLALVLLVSLLILLAFHFLIYRPLQKITEAAMQYASGNFEYETNIKAHDEMGDLSTSLKYMATQLGDMENYQKKFIGNISHDFRSPLTSIKGYVEALADGTIPVDAQEKYLKIILFETERLTELTKDLLTLNELDTKELLLEKELFDIHKTIKQVASSFEGRCVQKKVAIELVFATKSMEVYADRGKLQQVLYNLIDNAIKFSEIDSTIIIETIEQTADKVQISIKDHGEGISKEHLTKIWERFYKTDESRGKDKRGTGLGLAIVKEIMQAHNENINVVSTKGVGTEFIFSLTRKAPAKQKLII